MNEYQKEHINTMFRNAKERERNASAYLADPCSNDHARAERMQGVMMEECAFINGMINTLMTLGYAIHYDANGYPEVT